MHKALQKIAAVFRKPKEIVHITQLEEYLERKRQLWDESLKYIQELPLTKS